MCKPVVIQVGYKIGSDRREAVCINAELYRHQAQGMGYKCSCVAYDGGAVSFGKLRVFLRELGDRCRDNPHVVVHDFFVMAGLSLIVMVYLRAKGIRTRYIKTFINPPGTGSLDAVGRLRILLSNRLIYHVVARLADRVTYIDELNLPNFDLLPAPLSLDPGQTTHTHRPVRIAYLGHPLRIKGVHLLPQIVEQVHRSHPNAAEFRFSFTAHTDTPETAEALNNLPACRVEGPSDPDTLFGWADIYLLPVRHGYAASGSFNTVWEAMARGCCVVTSNVPHLPPIMKDDNTEWSKAATVEGFSNTVRGLIDHPERLAAKQRNALDAYRLYYRDQGDLIRHALTKLYGSRADTRAL